MIQHCWLSGFCWLHCLILEGQLELTDFYLSGSFIFFQFLPCGTYNTSYSTLIWDECIHLLNPSVPQQKVLFIRFNFLPDHWRYKKILDSQLSVSCGLLVFYPLRQKMIHLQTCFFNNMKPKNRFWRVYKRYQSVNRFFFMNYVNVFG